MKTRTHKLNTLSLSIVIALTAACAAEKSDKLTTSGDATDHSVVKISEIESDLTRMDIKQPFKDQDSEDRSIRVANEPVAVPAVPAMQLHEEQFQSREMMRSVVGGAQLAASPIVSANLDSIRAPRENLYRENYQHPADQQTLRVTDVPVSTFSIDVDTGAYSNMRRWVSRGELPPENSVRVEEFINYFDYDYPQPANTEQPFHVQTEIARTPWNPATHLLRIGIQGYEVPAQALPASNLVFLVDVSGSMQSQDKLPLLKQALSMLTRKMDANDTISMVVYAGASGVVLDSISGNQDATILTALQQLEAGGSTNGAAGIQLAYQLARQNFKKNGVNRVILATDGDFNVGVASTEELKDLVERQKKSGIALTTLGFGSGNYNDHMLEQLADVGNGNHAYIDRLSEAQKVLSEELSSTLLTIAKDVKIQVEFNPHTVSEYRLIGYENRALNEEDFNNDQVDAGEIGAGHTVTALYEVSFRGMDFQRLPPRRYTESPNESRQPPQYAEELAHLRIRYKAPDEDRSRLIETPILGAQIESAGASGSDDFRFAAAVAAYAQKLRGGEYLGSYSYNDIRALAAGSRGVDSYGYRSEFLQLISLANSLDITEPDNREQVALEQRASGS
jgi:Ca-activated chloride channel family protein